MNPSSQDHSVQPLDLANLLAATDTSKVHPMIVVEDEKVVDSNNDKDSHIHQQQEKRQFLSLNPDRGNLEKKAVVGSPLATTTLPKKLNLAGLVDRVRLAQLEEQRQQGGQLGASSPQQQPPDAAEIDGHHHLRPILSNSSSGSPPSERDYLHPGNHGGRPSSVYNVIPSPKDEDDDKGTHHSGMFQKVLNKDSVRNALNLNSAASAFTKTSRSKNLGNIDMPTASLVMTGSAVPALWLRRDDKGRRPPPVLFQMLKIAVTDSEMDLGMGKQIIFRVELQYGDVKWVLRRTVKDFAVLHFTLAAKRFENLPKFPGQMTYAINMALASLGMKTEDRMNYLRQTNLARREALQEYLLQVLQQLNYTVSYDLYEFLEISALSLTKDMGWKGKEAYIETKVTDHIHNICGFSGFRRWVKNWAILRDSYMAFTSNVGSDEPTDVFMFDSTFFVIHREHAMGLNMHHIEIGNKHRKIEIKGDHNREMLEWMDHFERMKLSSPWLKVHRFGSFAPEREEAKVRYYVDGKDYFHAVSDAILAAKTEIYICDWWLSPELYLRRPPEENEEFRLDKLLTRKAREGVMIYIVIYKEISLALTLDSAHTKIWLQDLHPNIQVQRHPDHLGVKTTQFWAHHEKICVIDCRLAFIGGLDLCFGRYDSRTHQLSDYHPSGKSRIWTGQDYSNPRIKDFVNVKDYNADLIERKLLPRMPWHDVSLGVAGPPARDIARHFVQRWNFVKKEKAMKKSHMKFLTPKGEYVSTRNETGWTGSQKVQVLRSSTVWSQGVEVERSIQDAYLDCIAKAEHFIYIENQFFVTLATENGNPDIKNTIGIALVNRILKAHRENQKFRVIVVMPLMPAFEADIISPEAGTLRKVMHFQYVSISRGGNSVLERLVAAGVDPDKYIGFFGLRSFDRIKHGKFDAIVEAVKEAELLRQQQQRKNGDAHEQTAVPDQNADAAAPDEADRDKDTKPAASSKNRCLSSRFLLEPLPKEEEAARIIAVAEERKALDMQKSWDESITKRAMNPAIREVGYIPAATETTLADEELNEKIQLETLDAEDEARRHSYRRTGRTKAEPLDGLGTLVRTGIENAKGYKYEGDLEPPLQRFGNKHPTFQKLRHPLQSGLLGSGHGGKDSVNPGNIVVSHGYETTVEHAKDLEERLKRAKGFEQEDVEAIIEPMSATSADSTEDTAADPKNVPNADEPGPVKVEQPVIDNEVDDFITEQLYIHSKLMIVDDRIIICGSANINDRSQVGFRDSEIAMIIEDTEMIPSFMNGVPYKVGKLAHTLRADLFKEHLGLLPHVEHDVVTKASVLPVDLDKPHKDPEEARLELSRKVQEEEQRLLQQQAQERPQMNQIQGQPGPGVVAAEGISSRNTNGRRLSYGIKSGHGPGHQHRFNDGMGHVQVYTPNQEETDDIYKWHTPNPQASHKKRAADDPKAADDIVRDPLHDDFYESWWKRVANTNTTIFREVFRCVPDDGVESWDDYRTFVPDPKKVLTGHVAMKDATVEEVKGKLQKVTGHLVEFPTKFLAKENLLGGIVETTVVPMEIFT